MPLPIDQYLDHVERIHDYFGAKPPFVTPREEKARLVMERHPWWGRSKAQAFSAAHPGMDGLMASIWESYAVAYQEEAKLSFRAWDDNRRFSYGSRDDRRKAVAEARDFYVSLKKKFWADTSFLHSAKFLSRHEYAKHWPLPNTPYSELIVESARSGRKRSLFFPAFRESDLEMIYWIVAEYEVFRFINEGASSRCIRIGFPIGFSRGRETEFIMLSITRLHVHGYPIDGVNKGASLIDFSDLDFGSYSSQVGELERRCRQYAARK